MRTYKIEVYAKNRVTKRVKMVKEFNTISEAFDYAVAQNKIQTEKEYMIGYEKGM